MPKKKKHTSEFKQEVIDYSLTTDKPVTQICKEFDISYGTFYAWKNEILGSSDNQNDNEEVSESSKQEIANEIRQLRKELAAAKRREEILKKAAIILGEAPPNNMK